MKCIAVLLFVLTIFLGFTKRELNGGYVNENSDKQGYYFWSDTKEFIWFNFHGGVKEFGRGTYALTRDSITLNFGSARRQFDIQESTWPVSRGQESIIVRFFNENGKPLAGLEVKLEKAGLMAVTNEDGIAVISTTETSIYNDEIDLRIDDYRTYQAHVILEGKHNEFIVVADKGRVYKENQKVRLKINIAINAINVTSNNTGNIPFKRVSRNKFMDLYHGFKR